MRAETMAAIAESLQTNRNRRALVQAGVLAALMVWAFSSEARKIYEQAMAMPDAAHALCAPALVALLIYARREALAADLRRGSLWGVAAIVVAVAAYALTTWPFYFGYGRKLQFATASAGIVLAVGGWRLLLRCLPLLLLVVLAQPIGWNEYAALVIKPETWTMNAVARMLDALPGTIIELKGADLTFIHRGVNGYIALGDPHRGFSIPLSYLIVVLFVVFSRVRPMWQLLVLGLAAGPIVVVCNTSRLLLQGVLTIWWHASPLDGAPRDISIAASLIIAYLLTAGIAAAATGLFVDTRDSDAAGDEVDMMP